MKKIDIIKNIAKTTYISIYFILVFIVWPTFMIIEITKLI